VNRLAEMRKPGVMLILTCWQTREAKERLRLYGRELGVSPSDMEIATFPISADWTGEEWEFAVIGFLARPQASPGQP
jgi:hypothetical protein